MGLEGGGGGALEFSEAIKKIQRQNSCRGIDMKNENGKEIDYIIPQLP